VLRHPCWHTIGLPLLGLMYVRAKDIAKVPAKYHCEFRLPPKRKNGPRRGRPRKYGTQLIHLARRAAHPLGWETIECFIYGETVTKTIKTFLVTYRPAGGVIRVIIVKEERGCEYFYCTQPDATRA